jgi:hypothetical protein
VRRFFDLRSPVADYISVPRSYVILQRINLGLFAVLGELSATANWRAIAEEIWPFVQGPPPPRWDKPRPHGARGARKSRRDRRRDRGVTGEDRPRRSLPGTRAGHLALGPSAG